MTWTKTTLAAVIDHATLKPEMTDDDIRSAADLCKDRKVGAMCVRPSDMALACELLKGSPCVPSMVVGFPHGANRTEVKALEARLGIEDGARELDMVMNIGKFLSGDYDYVRKDIEAVAAFCRPAGVLLKVILEVCYLSVEQIEAACGLCEAAGADYVKTSTGFGTGAATPESVAVMVRVVGERLSVKASGGIRNYGQAVDYLDQGCRRLGIGATEQILDEAPD